MGIDDQQKHASVCAEATCELSLSQEGGKLHLSLLVGICFLAIIAVCAAYRIRQGGFLWGGKGGGKVDIKSELRKWNAQSDEEVLQATLEDVRYACMHMHARTCVGLCVCACVWAYVHMRKDVYV